MVLTLVLLTFLTGTSDPSSSLPPCPTSATRPDRPRLLGKHGNSSLQGLRDPSIAGGRLRLPLRPQFHLTLLVGRRRLPNLCRILTKAHAGTRDQCRAAVGWRWRRLEVHAEGACFGMRRKERWRAAGEPRGARRQKVGAAAAERSARIPVGASASPRRDLARNRLASSAQDWSAPARRRPLSLTAGAPGSRILRCRGAARSHPGRVRTAAAGNSVSVLAAAAGDGGAFPRAALGGGRRELRSRRGCASTSPASLAVAIPAPRIPRRPAACGACRELLERRAEPGPGSRNWRIGTLRLSGSSLHRHALELAREVAVELCGP